MLGQMFRGKPGGEIPAATARLAPLIIAQRVGQSFGNFLRCRGGKIGWDGLGCIGHAGKLCRGAEQNKNI